MQATNVEDTLLCAEKDEHKVSRDREELVLAADDHDVVSREEEAVCESSRAANDEDDVEIDEVEEMSS